VARFGLREAEGIILPVQPSLDRAGFVRDIFRQIAPRYDLMNRLMTGGQDVRWRREVIHRARLLPHARLLDVGAGTGDLAFGAARCQPAAQVVAADFMLDMLQVGRERDRLTATAADALDLPFAAGTFDAVVSGFLMRNVDDRCGVLREQRRVLKPGGRIIVLDTTRPSHGVLLPFIRFHMRVVIPLLGQLVTGSRSAYEYLATSTESFLRAEELAAQMSHVGFKNIGFRKLMFGVIAIHWGDK
jgi:demethylmenaquinone methyltransferase/2-methoxy-6-polyprenyl-1,4-benzoquinol methylase